MAHDDVISEFVFETGVDASLASDLLREKSWDLIGALKAYQTLFIADVNKQATIEIVNDDQNKCSIDTSEYISTINVGGIDRLSNGLLTCDFSKSKSNNGINNDDHQSSTDARFNVAKGIAQAAVVGCGGTDTRKECHIETPSYAFTLPNLTMLAPDFRKFLEKDIIETSTLRGLELSGHLNWWTLNGVAQRLWPLATSGDGNCLLHAASLGMWGFHDRLLILRKALYLILTKGSRRHALWRRWRWQQHHSNKQAGLIYSESEWHAEWNNVVRLASPQPRSKPNSSEPVDPDRRRAAEWNAVNDDVDNDCCDQIYESLEDIHVFALAHVLKRPILVVADTVLKNANGEELAPIPFGGIYLPLECHPQECHRSPLVLCYDAAHFSALVTMQSNSGCGRAIVPITDKEHRLLSVHFVCDPGPDFTWWSDAADTRIADRSALSAQQQLALVCRYLDVIKVPLRRSSTLGRREVFVADEASVDRPLPRRTGSLIDIGEETPSQPVDRGRSRRSKLIAEWTQQLKKKLLSRHRSSRPVVDRHPLTNGSAVSSKKLPLLVGEVHDANCLVGAQLHTDAHHQYMDDMVNNYLRSARQRFDEQQGNCITPTTSTTTTTTTTTTINRREARFSRSFSASSLLLTCMNGECQQPATHQTNFLCTDCFRYQKELMTSFSTTQPSHQHSRSDATAVKSQTMPAMLHTFSGGGGGTDRRSSFAMIDDEPPQLPSIHQHPLVAVRQRKSSECSSEVTRQYGVTAVPGAHGVTHYYLPRETEYCRSPHCANYSNGHATLCNNCLPPSAPNH